MAVSTIANQIRNGEIEVGLAIGIESMSATPDRGPNVFTEEIVNHPVARVSSSPTEKFPSSPESLLNLTSTLSIRIAPNLWDGPPKMFQKISTSLENEWTNSPRCRTNERTQPKLPADSTLRFSPSSPSNIPKLSLFLQQEVYRIDLLASKSSCRKTMEFEEVLLLKL